MSHMNAISRPLDQSFPLERTDGQEIVNDLNQAYEMLDAVLAHSLRLSAKLVETGHAMGLDPKSGQKLFTVMSAHTETMIQSRAELLSAHQQAHRIRLRSTLRDARMWGCPYIEEKETPDTLSSAEPDLRVAA